MKHVAKYVSLVVVGSLVVTTACGGGPTQPAGLVTLDGLAFAKPVFEAGDPIVVVAGAEDSVAEPAGIVRIASSGEHMQADLIQWGPWETMTDEQLLAVLVVTDGEALVGFNNAAELMKVEMADSGIVITHEYHLVPAVAATLPIELALLVYFRHHPSIAYVEPDVPGVYLAQSEPPFEVDLLASISTTGDNLFHVESGSELVATYVQPNGTVLRAVAHMR